MDWKKRGRKGWTGKKFAKNETKGRERQYGDSEAKQQLQEDFEGDEFRYKGGKKKKNPIASLEYRLDWYKKTALESELREEKYGRSRTSSGYWKKRAKEIEKEIDELKKKL